MNDIASRLAEALNAAADQAPIDPDAWQQNRARLHSQTRKATGRYLVMSTAGLVAAAVVAFVAIVLWPHNHGPSVPAVLTPTVTPTPSATASTPGPTPAPSTSPPTSPPTGGPGPASAGAQNLPIPSDVRAQLRTVFLASTKLPASQVTGPVAGSVYYGYLPATDTYWAVARFEPNATASQQTGIDMQDGGNRGVFHRRAGQPWQVGDGGVGFPCYGYLPAAMYSVWNLQLPPECPSPPS